MRASLTQLSTASVPSSTRTRLKDAWASLLKEASASVLEDACASVLGDACASAVKDAGGPPGGAAPALNTAPRPVHSPAAVTAAIHDDVFMLKLPGARASAHAEQSACARRRAE